MAHLPSVFEALFNSQYTKDEKVYDYCTKGNWAYEVNTATELHPKPQQRKSARDQLAI